MKSFFNFTAMFFGKQVGIKIRSSFYCSNFKSHEILRQIEIFLRRLHDLQVYDEDKMPYSWFSANSFEVNTSNKNCTIVFLDRVLCRYCYHSVPHVHHCYFSAVSNDCLCKGSELVKNGVDNSRYFFVFVRLSCFILR